MSIWNKVKQLIVDFADKYAPFNPADLNDEIADLTEWDAISNAFGRQRGLRRLHIHSPLQARFEAGFRAYLGPTLFLLIGLITLIVAAGAVLAANFSLAFVCLILGAAFSVIGFLTLRYLAVPRTFDLTTGYFWIGNVAPTSPDDFDLEEATACRISQIYAVQLVTRRSKRNRHGGFTETNDQFGRKRTNTNTTPTYQLNLVLKDGSRLLVVEHGLQSLLQTDAAQLAKWLDLPLWNAT